MKSKKSVTPKSGKSVKRFLDGVPSFSATRNAPTSANRGAKQVNVNAGAPSQKHLDILYPGRTYPGIDRLRDRAYPAERHYAGLSSEVFERAYSGRSYPNDRGYPEVTGISKKTSAAKRDTKVATKKTR